MATQDRSHHHSTFVVINGPASTMNMMRRMYGEYAEPAPLTEQTINAPRILHGTSRETRDAWKRVVRQAVKDGTWDGVFASLEMTSLNALTGDILTYIGRADFRPEEPVWRLNWIAKTKPFIASVLGKKAGLEDAFKLTRRLMVEGMREAWFTVGLIDVEDVDSPRGRPGDRPGVEREMLEWYIHWAPGISAIQTRFADGVIPARSKMLSLPYAWIFNVLRYARLAGFDLSWDVEQTRLRINSHFNSACDQYLVEVGIAEMRDGQCRLRNPVP